MLLLLSFFIVLSLYKLYLNETHPDYLIVTAPFLRTSFGTELYDEIVQAIGHFEKALCSKPEFQPLRLIEDTKTIEQWRGNSATSKRKGATPAKD